MPEINNNLLNLSQFFWDYSDGSSDFRKYWTNAGYNNQTIGQKDWKVPPDFLTEVCRDGLIFGITSKIKQIVNKKPYFFKKVDFKMNKFLISLLQSANFNLFVDKFLEIELGSGGGNGLLYVNEYEKTIHCFPFYANGKYRVQVWGNYDYEEIYRYEILGKTLESVIRTFQPEEVMQIRSSYEGDFIFAINPAVISSRYYWLKKDILAGLQTSYKNITNSKRYLSPDKSMLEGDNAMSFVNAWKEWITNHQSNLKGFIVAPMPMQIQDFYLKPSDLNVEFVMNWIDDTIAGIYSVSKSSIGADKESTRANLEQLSDNLMNDVGVFYINKIIKITEEYILPRLLESYVPYDAGFTIGKEFDEEDLQLRTQALQVLKEVLPVLKNNGYDVEEESVANLVNRFGLKLKSTNSNLDAQQEKEWTGEQEKVSSDEIKRSFDQIPNNFLTIDDLKKTDKWKKEIKKALDSQLNSVVYRDLDSIKNIETYLSKDKLTKILKEMMSESAEHFNQNYDTNFETLPIYLRDYTEALAKYTLYGYDKADFSKYEPKTLDLFKDFDKEYKGIDATTKSRLANKTETSTDFLENRSNDIYENLETQIYNTTQEELAKEKGFTHVGVWTANDSKVRKEHANNEKKFWEIGSRRDFSKDFRCRCVYMYNVPEYFLKLGFSPF